MNRNEGRIGAKTRNEFRVVKAYSPKLSIVATLYKSQNYISEFCSRSGCAAQKLVGESYEILLVNDGSPDDSLEIAIKLAETDSHVGVIDLSRNFGHHRAIMTGLSYASGENIFLIDSDLEEEPEWLPSFSLEMEKEHCDVVYGVQARRKGGLLERVTGKIFYKIFNAFSGLSLPENIVVARLMTSRYVAALLRHDEREVFLAGLWQITGFKQIPFIITKNNKSETTYSFRMKVSQFVNSITSFSNTPLKAIFYTGITISSFSALYIFYLIIQWFFLETTLSGWTSVMASIWLIGGMIISFIGVIGIYLAKIFSETKRRPYTIVRNVYSQNAMLRERGEF